MVHTEWDNVYDTLEEKKNHRDVKKISSCQGLGFGEGMRDEYVERRWLLGQWNYPVNTIIVDMCNYAFNKTHRMYNTVNEP